MGWTSTADPMSNVQLTFSSPEQAIKFCKKRGWKYEVRTPRNKMLVGFWRGNRESREECLETPKRAAAPYVPFWLTQSLCR